jgi:hypothetical protein
MKSTICDSTSVNINKGGLIVRQAQSILDAHTHFRGRAGQFEFDCREDVLVVRGTVPTYYLKQVLQNVLMDVEGVRLIDNQVSVVYGDAEIT